VGRAVARCRRGRALRARAAAPPVPPFRPLPPLFWPDSGRKWAKRGPAGIALSRFAANCAAAAPGTAIRRESCRGAASCTTERAPRLDVMPRCVPRCRAWAPCLGAVPGRRPHGRFAHFRPFSGRIRGGSGRNEARRVTPAVYSRRIAQQRPPEPQYAANRGAAQRPAQRKGRRDWAPCLGAVPGRRPRSRPRSRPRRRFALFRPFLGRIRGRSGRNGIRAGIPRSIRGGLRSSGPRNRNTPRIVAQPRAQPPAKGGSTSTRAPMLRESSRLTTPSTRNDPDASTRAIASP